MQVSTATGIGVDRKSARGQHRGILTALIEEVALAVDRQDVNVVSQLAGPADYLGGVTGRMAPADHMLSGTESGSSLMLEKLT